MLLGYGVDGPIYSGIDALLSTALAGRPGQGIGSVFAESHNCITFWAISLLLGTERTRFPQFLPPRTDSIIFYLTLYTSCPMTRD
jgi:hypothetical protein